MLTGPEIIRERDAGRLLIDPFDPAQVNPNSYDVRLAPEVARLDTSFHAHSKTQYVNGGMIQDFDRPSIVDPKNPPALVSYEMTEDGMVLYPGVLYLASTWERAGSQHFQARVDGKSSLARLGLMIHFTAGFGDVGFDGTWTLEMMVMHPMRVYPFMRVGQVSFVPVIGTLQKYAGNYSMADHALGRPVASRMGASMKKDAENMARLYAAYLAKQQKPKA